MVDTASEERHLVPGVRGLLFAFSGLTLLATNQLYLLSARTGEAFAWTIDPPLTAAFLGGGYGAGFVLVVLSLRRGTWASARIGFLTVLVFTVVSLAATLLHLDRFHFGAEDVVPRAAAWIWLAVYIVVPVAMLAVLPSQWRAPGVERRPGRRLGAALKVILGLQAVALLVVGSSLFAVPRSWALWPWPLTPLTARSIASWLIALGVAGFLAIVEDDLHRLRPAAITYATLGVLQLVALVRYRGDIDWTTVAATMYLLGVLIVLTVGLVGSALGALPGSTEDRGPPMPRSDSVDGRRRGRGSAGIDMSA